MDNWQQDHSFFANFAGAIMRFLILLAIGLFTCAADLRAEEKPDPRESLDTAIAESIRLIEAKDTAAFIKFILLPMKLKQKLEKHSIEELVMKVEPSLPDILKMLKQIQGMKPRLNESETEAVYELKEPIGGQKDAKFYKEEKFWYLR